MGTRLELHALLKSLMPEEKKNVYHQPPPDHLMKYPCIRYVIDDIRTHHADNIPYKSKKRYTLTVMDQDPDSEIPDEIAKLPLCAFDRFYTAEQLNHWVFTLYF